MGDMDSYLALRESWQYLVTSLLAGVGMVSRDPHLQP